MTETTDQPATGTQRAPLSKRWVRKMLIITVVLLGFGAWGFYDAVSVYPKRGERHASWAKWQYLEASKKADDELFGFFYEQSSIPDPVQEFADLSSPDEMLRNRTQSQDSTDRSSLRATARLARHAWLQSLKRIGRLDAEQTIIEDPNAELARLQGDWLTASSNPKPLSGFDIPSQWLIMGVCWGIALIMLYRFMRVASTKYTWDPSSKTLTVPGGSSITPADLEEVDKRKWDKFIVFLKIKDGHTSLGGREVRFDTYQHDELEGWILAMEDEAFGSEEDRESGSEPS